MTQDDFCPANPKNWELRDISLAFQLDSVRYDTHWAHKSRNTFAAEMWPADSRAASFLHGCIRGDCDPNPLACLHFSATKRHAKGTIDLDLRVRKVDYLWSANFAMIEGWIASALFYPTNQLTKL